MAIVTSFARRCRMHFVWITREVPFRPDNGALIYSNGLLQALLGHGANGTLICYSRQGTTVDEVDGLEIWDVPAPKRSRALSLLSPLQSDAYRLKTRRLANLVRRALDQAPDAVIIDGYWMGWVLPVLVKAERRTARPIVVHISHNYESTLRRQVARAQSNILWRFVLTLDATKAVALEQSLVRGSDLIITNTDEDKDSFAKDAPSKQILTLTPAYDGKIAATRPITADLPRRVVVTGSFEWIAKQASLRRFLEVARDPFTEAGIELLVVGRAPQQLIAELARSYPFARLTGPVSDVTDYLADARIGMMPDEIGGGFKHKYLYYIFAGLPVATIRSQFAGLPLDVDRDVIARDTIEDLVDAVVRIVDDIPQLERMRQRCFDACKSAFAWEDRGQKLYNSIEAAMNARRHSPELTSF